MPIHISSYSEYVYYALTEHYSLSKTIKCVYIDTSLASIEKYNHKWPWLSNVLEVNFRWIILCDYKQGEGWGGWGGTHLLLVIKVCLIEVGVAANRPLVFLSNYHTRLWGAGNKCKPIGIWPPLHTNCDQMHVKLVNNTALKYKTGYCACNLYTHKNKMTWYIRSIMVTYNANGFNMTLKNVFTMHAINSNGTYK